MMSPWLSLCTFDFIARLFAIRITGSSQELPMIIAIVDLSRLGDGITPYCELMSAQ